MAEALDRLTVPGSLWRREGEKIRCLACAHRCLIGAGSRGICKVRFNRAGELRVPFGYVAGLACDPVEKKPFFHVLPGAGALTFGMLGCDFKCGYCQNWVTSQALRDDAAGAGIRQVTPQQIVQTARRSRAQLAVSSYNEPLITSEWSRAVFAEAAAEGLLCAYVSNGNATPEILDYLQPYLQAYKVDLKTFNPANYRQLGGVLDHVLATIRMLHERGIWLEVLTLVIPGFNNSDAELRSIAGFIAGVSCDIPWHVTAFHQDYKMTQPANTTADDLVRAAEIGEAAGLNYVYAGNLPGYVGEWENTRCPNCRETLVKRRGYFIEFCKVAENGQCPRCQTAIPGIWSSTL